MKKTIMPVLKRAALTTVSASSRCLRLTIITAFCAVFLSASCPVASAYPPATTVSAIQRQAEAEGKLYFIHFAADWCMPCQWMEKNVFTDERLAAYIEEAYLSLRANVDEEEGQQLKERYGVTLLPSLLVFSSRGQLLGQLEGAMEAEALYEALKQYDRPAHRSPAGLSATSGPEEILSSPKPILHLSRPALIPDAGRPAVRPVLAAQPPASNFSTVAREEAYYTLQLGVFSSHENAVRRCAVLERELGIGTQLNTITKSGRALYKVYLGRFNSYEQASHYLQGLGQEGFVKKIDI